MPAFLILCCDSAVLVVLSPETQLEIFQGLVRTSRVVTLINVETRSQTAVTGLFAFLPKTAPPSLPPPDIKVRSESCNVNAIWDVM